jgi:hypothetical protein
MTLLIRSAVASGSLLVESAVASGSLVRSAVALGFGAFQAWRNGPDTSKPLIQHGLEHAIFLEYANQVLPNSNPAKLPCNGPGEVNEFIIKEAFITPMHFAARQGNFAAVRVLVEEKHGNPLIRDHLGRTPLTMAVEFQQHEVMKTLIKAHKDALGTPLPEPDYFFYFKGIPSHVVDTSDPLQNADEKAFELLMDSGIPVGHYSSPHTRYRQAKEILTRYVTGESSLSKEETIKRLDFLVSNGVVNYGEIPNIQGNKYFLGVFLIFLKSVLHYPINDLLTHLVTISKDLPSSKRVTDMHNYLAKKI